MFSIDLEISEHKVFFMEVLNICEAEDSSLQKLPCYKSVKNLVPLRKSGLRKSQLYSVRFFCPIKSFLCLVTGALAACHYIQSQREKIFGVLYKELNSTNNELQQAAHQCMEKVRLLMPPTQSRFSI